MACHVDHQAVVRKEVGSKQWMTYIGYDEGPGVCLTGKTYVDLFTIRAD